MVRPRSRQPSQVDLFAPKPILLPDEAELAGRFAQFNAVHFDGTLPPAIVRWSLRMRIAGSCDYEHRIITLSRLYHLHFPEEIDDTLKHEMIHLVFHRHDAVFAAEARRVGASLHCREYDGLHPRARYVYICPNCRTLFPRSRRERLYCGRCCPRRIDPRFELVLREPASRLAARRPLTARQRPSPRHRKLRANGDLFDSW
ncbi:MAG TPA: SprT-like domain-containing protein [candidate division Zixibacteria bacterium]|jgi:predicted SprT family Zn-dependent metalloprotease